VRALASEIDKTISGFVCGLAIHFGEAKLL
jgi:hypothetical protein